MVDIFTKLKTEYLHVLFLTQTDSSLQLNVWNARSFFTNLSVII